MANPILEHLRLSGTTYDLVDSTAIHSLDGYWNSGQTQDAITAATNALAESIAEQGYQTSGDVQNAISGKADTTAVTEAISEAVSGKVDNDTYTAYTAATDTALGNKADTTAVTQAISEAVSGKLDTSTFETYSGNVDTALASKIAGAAWDSTTSHLNFYDNVSATGTILTYVDGADWVKDSFLKSVTIEDKEISGETVTCLVFVFETESGETETDIPLTDIFDPSNYVNMSTYTAYTAATSTELDNKADTTAMTQAISEATSGKVDNSTYTAYTAATDAAIAGKANTGDVVTNVGATADYGGVYQNQFVIYQTKNGSDSIVGRLASGTGIEIYRGPGTYTDYVKVDTNTIQEKLSSGTNIKTINGTSILGSGNLDVQTLPTVQGTTLIFS